MTPERKLKIQNILYFIGIGLVFGLLYNFLFYPRTFVEFAEAGSISILIGLILGIIEEFVFNRVFQRLAFLWVTTIRAVLYSLIISIVLCLVLSIETASVEQIGYTDPAVDWCRY